MENAHFASLATFRTAVYAALERRRDALFELCDTLLTTGPVPSLPLLSVQPQYQRRWGSRYDALAVGRIDDAALEQLLSAHPLTGGEPIYAVDVSVWPRCDAETSPERAMYYHASRHSAGELIVAGWAYSWIAQLGFARDSWTAPMRVRRLRPHENSKVAAAEQITAFLADVPADSPLPWFVFDAGYDSVQLTQALGPARAAIFVRVRFGRCFYADPTSQPPTGRPRRHRHKFACDEPATWPEPDGQLALEDGQYGTVRVRAWTALHPKTHGVHAKRDAHGRCPIVRRTLLLVEVSRLPQHTRQPQALWLWWHTPDDPDSIPDRGPAPGAPTSGASMWSIRSGFSNRRSIGRSPACATPNRPTAGPGSWCWPTPSCAWLVPSPATTRCRGSVPSQRANAPLSESDARFRSFCSASPSWPARQNPVDGPQAVRKANARAGRRAIRPSPRRSSARLTPPKSDSQLVILPSATAPSARRSPPHGLKSQAENMNGIRVGRCTRSPELV